MQQQIKIAVWNANGLAQHGLEVKHFLLNHKIDIMLISEAHFTEKTYLKIPNYIIYITRRPDGKAFGGSAIIIKQKIKHHVLENLSEDFIQATSIAVDEWAGKLVLSAVYCPPRHQITKDQFKSYFSKLGPRFIAGGDYNAKHTLWGSRLITPKGRQLFQAMKEFNLSHISTGHPTYWPTDLTKIPDLIDFCITKGINERHIKAEPCFDLSSDHSPIIVTLSTSLQPKISSMKLHNKSTNWELFRVKVTSSIDLKIPLRNKEDIENAADMFNQILTKSTKESTHFTTEGNEILRKSANNIMELIKEKRALRKKWQVTRFPADKSKLNKITKELKNALYIERNEGIQNYLRQLSPTQFSDYSLWKATKNLKKPQDRNPPIKKTDGTWAKSDNEKAEEFAKHLAEVFKPFERTVPIEAEDIIHQYLTNPIVEQFSTRINKKEVKKTILKEIHSKKAPGLDFITGKILKELPDLGFSLLTMIFNAIIRIGHFPKQWKRAEIILVQKPGKPDTELTSYRPISLLPITSKVFEKILAKHIISSMEDNHQIPPHQFGFRQKHSTIEQVHRVVNQIKSDLDTKKYCSAVFLDITQAFDKVWHPGLLYKIRKLIPQHFNVLKSYIENRQFTVKHRGVISSIQSINSGVPQGSVLGPILYIMYTYDIPLSSNTTTATFADDTAIMASHEDPYIASQRIQTHLNKLETWLHIWRIKVNETKSTHITFTNRTRNCPPVKLNDCQLPHVEDIKYLGMHLDRRLTWKKHIWTKRKQLGIKYTKMYWLMGKKSEMTLDNKVLLYQSILKPIWTYGIQLWGSASLTNIEIIQRFQSKVLRNIANAPYYVPNWMLHEDLQTKTVKEEITLTSRKYHRRLLAHPNALASEIVNQQGYNRLKRTDPLDLPNRFSIT